MRTHTLSNDNSRANGSQIAQREPIALIQDNRKATIKQRKIQNHIDSIASGKKADNEVIQLAQCSVCKKHGHNKRNRKFHPLGKTYKDIPKFDSAGVFKKHKRILQGGKNGMTKVAVVNKGGNRSKIYIYIRYKELRNKRGKLHANYMLEQLATKYDNANRLIANSSETATIGSAVHENTSSQQFAKAEYQRVNGTMTGIPLNPSGSVNIRETAKLLSPAPTGVTYKNGSDPEMDVDEYVSRNYGGTGSHSTAPVPGLNQWFMERYANSQAGAIDTSVLADAKKQNCLQNEVTKFKLVRVSSFTNI